MLLRRCHCNIIVLTSRISLGEDQSRYLSSQWETLLHCNDVSHWLGAHLGWSLYFHNHLPMLITLSYHEDANSVITGGPAGCRNDNLQGHQWWQSWKMTTSATGNDKNFVKMMISISVQHSIAGHSSNKIWYRMTIIRNLQAATDSTQIKFCLTECRLFLFCFSLSVMFTLCKLYFWCTSENLDSGQRSLTLKNSSMAVHYLLEIWITLGKYYLCDGQ